jgi:putative FmdB family regulatory protein
MPLYEYECQDCEHTFESLVRDQEPTECPQCHQKRLQRLHSVPAKPPSSSPSLPMSCNSSGPPCGPHCARWP